MVLEAAKKGRFSKPIQKSGAFLQWNAGQPPLPAGSLQPGLELAALEELGSSTYAGITVTLEPQQRAGRD